MSQHESLEEIEADEQRWQLENEFETMTAEQSDASGSLIGGLVGGAGSAVVFGSLLYGGYQMSQGNSMGNKFLAYRVQAQGVTLALVLGAAAFSALASTKPSKQ